MIRIHIEELTFPPEERVILHDIDLDIHSGDFIVISGASASGKSMLLHAITGAAVKHFQGKLKGYVYLGEHDVDDIPLTCMCDHIGYMMQSPQNQITSSTVGDEVAFALANMNRPWDEIRTRVHQALGLVDLTSFYDRKVDELSGGQAQRVVFASILAMETPILILDQPAAELDAQGRKTLYEHLGQLNKTKGVTVIMVMDRAGEILPHTNRVLTMEAGTVTQDCTPSAFKKHLDGTYKPVILQTTSTNRMLEAKQVSYTYKNGQVGCCDVTLDIFKGEFVGLVGHNGSGKTTLLKVLEGLLWPDKGEVYIQGQKINKKNVTRLRHDLGFVFQNPDMQIFSNTVKDEVGFRLKYLGHDAATMDRRIREVLELVELSVDLMAHPHSLSRSQRQKLVIASALATDPEMLIADEPTSGLDDEQSALMMDVFSRWQHLGKTILVVSHDLERINDYASRILLMKDHRLIQHSLQGF
jgi:energy-coupling factor transport system ATP-binding protein